MTKTKQAKKLARTKRWIKWNNIQRRNRSTAYANPFYEMLQLVRMAMHR